MDCFIAVSLLLRPLVTGKQCTHRPACSRARALAQRPVAHCTVRVVLTRAPWGTHREDRLVLSAEEVDRLLAHLDLAQRVDQVLPSNSCVCVRVPNSAAAGD
jgi:hypothetical protein